MLQEILNPAVDPVTGQAVRRKYPVKRSHKIVRDIKNFELKTVEETKNYQLVFDKRVVEPNDFLTFPYGYGDMETSAAMEQDIHALLDL